jgi:hypothetical protein
MNVWKETIIYIYIIKLLVIDIIYSKPCKKCAIAINGNISLVIYINGKVFLVKYMGIYLLNY